MKRVYSFVSLLTIFALTLVMSTSYAQCDGNNSYIYGGKKGACKSGIALVIADSNGQHVTPTAAMTLPHFVGGNKAMCRYINKTKKYPETLKSQKVSGTTTIQAKVKADSTLTDIKVVQSSGYKEFDDEALRVVKSFPKMAPATQSCEAEDMIMQIPVTFIPDEELQKAKEEAQERNLQKEIENIGHVILYFDNDRPDPKTTTDNTNIDYMATYNAYLQANSTYLTGSTQGMNNQQQARTKEAIAQFFRDSITPGYECLTKLTDLIEDALNHGKTVEITISGFASPLSNSSYNKHLSSRRIESVLNYMARANGGVLAPYINGQKAGLIIHKNPEGAVNHSFTSQSNRETVYGIKAMRDRKIVIDNIMVK